MEIKRSLYVWVLGLIAIAGFVAFAFFPDPKWLHEVLAGASPFTAGVCIWQLIVEIDYQAAEIGILRNGSSERVIIEKLKTEQLKIVGEYTPEQTSLAQAGRALYHIIGGWQGARIELDTPKCKGIPYEFITYYLELSQGQGNELRPQNEFSEKKRWNGDGQFVRVMVDALQSYLADHGLATPQNNNHNPTVYNWNEVWKFLDPYKTNTEEVINE